MQPTAEDKEVLESVRAIARMLQAQSAGGSLLSGDARSSADLARQLSVLARQLAPLVPELAPGIGYTGARMTFFSHNLVASSCVFWVI